MKKARWTRTARDDLEVIDDEYRLDWPEYADRVGRTAIAAARFLADHPYAGAALDDRFERKWRVPKSPYSLIYKVATDGVVIVRVVHDASDWKPRI